MSHWVAENAKRNPTGTAIVFGAERLDHAELERRVAARAGALREAGVTAGRRVVLRLPPSPEHIVGLHAIWRLGASAVAMHPRLGELELAAQLARVAPFETYDALLRTGSLAESVRGAEMADSADSAAPAVVMFTSGTSGRSKPAILRFSNLEASARASRLRLGTDASDRWLLCLPLFHVGGLSIVVRAAVDGAAIVLHHRFDVAAVDHAIASEAVTRLSLVPTTLKRLLDLREGRRPPESLRTLLIGGAAAPAALLERARAAGLPVRASYGLTEAASQVATASADDALDGRVGRALPGTRLRIAGADGRALPADHEGEIQVAGPTVFAGYQGDPEATARAFDGEWFRTGDVGRIAVDGRLQVIDRRTDLVISGGENVYPAEVEAVLLEHPGIAEAAVWRRADEDLGHRVVAWLVPSPGERPDEEALRIHCRARLAPHKAPREFEWMAVLPRNEMGKVLRVHLR